MMSNKMIVLAVVVLAAWYFWAKSGYKNPLMK